VVGESVRLVVICHGRGLGIVAGMFVADWWPGVEVHIMLQSGDWEMGGCLGSSVKLPLYIKTE